MTAQRPPAVAEIAEDFAFARQSGRGCAPGRH